jgi:hypothetical protein
MRFFALLVWVAVVAAAAAGEGAGQGRVARDDTSWLQARLDAGGGRIFLPKLANGACYATRGLWVSHDRTQIVSDGACIRSLGPGPVRLVSPDGDPVASDAVFFVNRSRQFDPTPNHVTISGLRVVVPADTRTYGIAIFGHEVVVRKVTVEARTATLLEPRVDPRLPALGRRPQRGLGGELHRAPDRGQPDRRRVEQLPARPRRRQPVRRHRHRAEQPRRARARPPDRDNVIADNAGPGILVALNPPSGLSINADRMAIVRNRILRNGVGKGTEHGGIVFYGGQEDGRGRAVVARNVVSGNKGPGLAGWRMTLGVVASGNDLRGNEGGPSRGVKFVRGRG